MGLSACYLDNSATDEALNFAWNVQVVHFLSIFECFFDWSVFRVIATLTLEVASPDIDFSLFV